MLRILALGDVISPATVGFLSRRLWSYRREMEVDFTVVNGENAGFLSGIGSKDAALLLSGGADCITGGNHTMASRSIYPTRRGCKDRPYPFSKLFEAHCPAHFSADSEPEALHYAVFQKSVLLYLQTESGISIDAEA